MKRTLFIQHLRQKTKKKVFVFVRESKSTINVCLVFFLPSINSSHFCQHFSSLAYIFLKHQQKTKKRKKKNPITFFFAYPGTFPPSPKRWQNPLHYTSFLFPNTDNFFFSVCYVFPHSSCQFLALTFFL